MLGGHEPTLKSRFSSGCNCQEHPGIEQPAWRLGAPMKRAPAGVGASVAGARLG